MYVRFLFFQIYSKQNILPTEAWGVQISVISNELPKTAWSRAGACFRVWRCVISTTCGRGRFYFEGIQRHSWLAGIGWRHMTPGNTLWAIRQTERSCRFKVKIMALGDCWKQLSWFYYQYLLVTALYMLEPWERTVFSILFWLNWPRKGKWANMLTLASLSALLLGSWC